MTRASCAALLLAAACAPADPLQVPRTGRDFNERPLVQMQRSSGHNTYDNTPPGADLTWHLAGTRDIEIDIRDAALGRAPRRGDWWVAHDDDEPVTTACGKSGSFGDCLRLLAAWHERQPGHPFTTVWIDKKEAWSDLAGRGPADLDRIISAHFGPPDVFRPAEMVVGRSSLRETARRGDWPTHGRLAGRLMFVLTARTSENRRLHQYVAARGAEAWAYVAPHEAASDDRDTTVRAVPDGFDEFSAAWVGVYNFAWCSEDGDDACAGAWCYLLDDAAAANFLTRVWDLDSPGERAHAARAGANFLAVNCPWLAGDAQFCRKNDSCPDDP